MATAADQPLGLTAAAASAPQRTARRRLLADRAFRWLVAAGGVATVAGILGILVFIVAEIVPLMFGAKIVQETSAPLAGGGLIALQTDEYRSLAVGLTAAGTARTVRLSDGATTNEKPMLEGGAKLVRAQAPPLEHQLHFSTSDGRAIAVPVYWNVSYEGEKRVVEAEIRDSVSFKLDEAGAPLGAFAISLSDDGSAVAAGLLADGRLALIRREVTQNLMTGAVEEELKRGYLRTPRKPVLFVIDASRRNLYGAADDGSLLWWDLRGDAAKNDPQIVGAPGAAPVTALSLLIGDRSLAVGRATGAVEIWFQVRNDSDDFRLTHVRDLPPLAGRVVAFSPSMRNKGLVALDSTGNAALYHSTSGRRLWRGATGLHGALAIDLSPRGDGALIAGETQLASFAIDSPHPEATLGAFFGKVWYEGYAKPEFVWQSTGGSDDFEPKLSLVPLLYGTLKGTVFSLFLAIPLGVLGAMYVSQFMHPRFQRFVKPTVEIMAAMPTIVLGFLAGLWLAPKLQDAFAGLVLMGVLLPVLILAVGAALHQLPLRVRGRWPAGFEALVFTVVLALGIWFCLAMAPGFEAAAFGGSFPKWLGENFGWTYDQRNAVVVGLAMGFAIIPIIFAISEDAFSNVPRNLVSGALALGANRWQTVVRVVLPTASPGIFSAVMIGFGRAIGETMIVLMATGNTPIMDWSPFNGFRTLSANIAVEIPEAPAGGTLYRTLFLAALLLFIFTFIANTAAEVIRLRLRNKYSRL